MRAPAVWSVLFVILGLALRCSVFLQSPAVWHDEASVLLNLVSLDYVALVRGPLLCHASGPPLFLWISKTAGLLLGEEVWAYRFIPFLASCLALVLMAWAAHRLLPGTAATIAVCLMACSEQLLWHTCEAKPYALDVLAASGLLALYCAMRTQSVGRRSVAFAGLGACLLVLCYPACFLLGGVLLALLPRVLQSKRLSDWVGYGLFVAVTLGVFAFVAFGPARAQRDHAMEGCWRTMFPSWERPWAFPTWLGWALLQLLKYCFKPAGDVLVLFLAAGGLVLSRRGDRGLLLLLLGPLVLVILAACLHAYPFGGARVGVFLLPAFAILIAAGAGWLIDRLRTRSRCRAVLLAGLVLVPAVPALYRAVALWPRPDTAGAAAYVRQQRNPDEIVACNNDWCHMFYFRDLRTWLVTDVPRLKALSAERVWFIYVNWGAEPRLRERCARQMLGGRWTPLERREFQYTTVYLLQRARQGRSQVNEQLEAVRKGSAVVASLREGIKE